MKSESYLRAWLQDLVGYCEDLFLFWERRILSRGVVWFDLCHYRITPFAMWRMNSGGQGWRQTDQLEGCCYNLRGKAGEGAVEVSRSGWRGEEPVSQPMTQGQVDQTNPGSVCQKPREPTEINATWSLQTDRNGLPHSPPRFCAPCTWNDPSTIANENAFLRERDRHHYWSLERIGIHTLPITAPCWTCLQRSHKGWFCRILLEYYHALNLWHGELARLNTGKDAGWTCTPTILSVNEFCWECS